ncbi:MAG: hypothetical protein Q9226_000448 [Calogaya cf. arnoldii]
MATITVLSRDLHQSRKPPHQEILDQIKHAERKIFPRNEAFDFVLELKKRNTELIVIVDDDSESSSPIVAAYAVYAHTQKWTLLHKLCVLENFRRRGIARRLLLFQHQKLLLRGRSKVQLWVDEERVSASQLYSSIGFVQSAFISHCSTRLPFEGWDVQEDQHPPPILRRGETSGHAMALLVSLLFLAGKVVAAPDIALPINSQVPPVARISKPFSFTFSASTFTSNTGILDYLLTDAPAWLHFDASTRTLSGTPGPDAAGSPKFDLVATDTTGSTTMPVTLVVSTSAGPSLGTPVEKQLSAHDTFQSPDTILLPHSSALAVSFSPDTFVNTDHDTVYYAMCANNTPLPSWITFDTGSLSFSGTAPQNTSPDELPQTFNIRFTASDVLGFSAAVASFRVTVETHVLMFNKGYYAVGMTPGLPVNYSGLQGALRLNHIPVDHAIVRQSQLETPSWLSFDQNSWVLSGVPPISARSQNITVTAVDVYGEVAITTVLLQVETNSTADLFDGIPDSINATAGMDFNYTFNTSEVTAADAEIAVDLGLASSWLQFDDVNQELSGRVPNDLSPQDVVLNVTVSQGPKIRSEPLTISVQGVTRSTNGRSNDTPSPSAGRGPAVSNTTSAASVPQESESRSPGNNSRMAAAIAVPVIAICLLLILACCFFARRRRRRTWTDWSTEQKRKVSRPFLSDETRNQEHAGIFVEKPVPAVEKPLRAPFIDLPGFRTSIASRRHSFFRRSKSTADEAVQTPKLDPWDVYTRELSTGRPKEVDQRQYSLVQEERTSSARENRRTSLNKQAFRASKHLGITKGSPMKRTGQNKRRSDMSFASACLPANQRTSGFGHGRNGSSLGTYSSFGRIPRGIGHGNGGPVDWGHVRKSWRDRSRSSCWTTTNASDPSSRNLNSSDRSQNIGSTVQSFPRPPTSGTLENLSQPAGIEKTGDGRRESIRMVEPEPPLTYSLSLHAFNKRRARNRQNRNTFFVAGPSTRASSHLKWTHPVQTPVLSPTHSTNSATSILAKRRSSRFERSATRRTYSRSSSVSSPTPRKPIKPRPSPHKRGSEITPNDRGSGLATLISNAITQRMHSDSKSSIASSSRRFGGSAASGDFSNPSPELGLEEVKDEEGNRRWKYPDVHPNPLGLHTPVDTPPNGGSPELRGEQRHDGEDYVTARQMLLEPLGRTTAEGVSGRLQRMSLLRQHGVGGKSGAGEGGQRRALIGGSRGKRPVSVDNGLVARGRSMRGDLVGGDEEEHDIAFV